MSDPLIKVENVSKKFCRSLKRSLWYGMQDLGSELLGRRHGDNSQLRTDEFWAVRDVNFELGRGECLGLIGRNGAGKTTLLRMLNGLIKPDTGRIEMRGRVGALIALGAGFNPVLTGRENVYINAAVLGLTKAETGRHFDEIVAFAELEAAIDSPVQTYSSGMTVRLGFAIATTLQPEILILDEVLAVGDANFRHKCYHRINKLMTDAAVILVSHNMDAIAQTASSLALMDGGAMTVFHEPVEGIAAYHDANAQRQATTSDGGTTHQCYAPVVAAEVRILPAEVGYQGQLTVEAEITCDADLPEILISFTATNAYEQAVMCWHSSRHPSPLGLCKGRQLLRFSVAPLLLDNGSYHWNFKITRRGSLEHVVWLTRHGPLVVKSRHRTLGNIPYLPDASQCEHRMLTSP